VTYKLEVSIPANLIHAQTVAREFESWGERKPGIAGIGAVRLTNGFTAIVWRTVGGMVVVRETEPGSAS